MAGSTLACRPPTLPQCTHLNPRVCEVVHERHDGRQHLGVVRVLQLRAEIGAHLTQGLAGGPPDLRGGGGGHGVFRSRGRGRGRRAERGTGVQTEKEPKWGRHGCCE